MKLSIIIVSWNVAQLLKQCLDSIQRHLSNLSYEVIVIDNASTDESVYMLKHDYPWVRIIVNKVNKGFPKANNQGFEIASGEFILVLNPDTIIKANTIQNMLAIIEENDEIGMVGPRIIDEEGTITPPCKRNVPSLIDLFLKLFLIEKISLYIINKNQILKRIYNRRYFKSEYVQCISGACMLIKRKALDKVGYFDEAIPMYFEDNDLCFRFTKAGYKIYYCADAELIHICGASTKKTGKTKSFDLMVYKASDAFLKKHKTSMYFLIHRLILFSSALLFLGIDIILFPFLFQFKRNYLKSIIEKHFYTLLYALSIKESISIENNFKETEHLNSELNRK